MTIVRKTRTADIVALNSIERSAAELFRGTHMEFAADHPPLDPDKHKTAIAEGSHWTADLDDIPAGFCCAHTVGDLLCIDELAVGRGFQRTGLGRTLMDTAIRYAKQGFEGLCLVTDRELPWNRPFYAGLGFVDWTTPYAPVRQAMAEEIEAGFDPAMRCAMILRFD